jgi:hypothetical protein
LKRIKEKFLIILSWSRQYSLLLVIEQNELKNMNHFLLIIDLSELTVHRSANTLLSVLFADDLRNSAAVGFSEARMPSCANEHTSCP